ncbi:hypothetical protein F5146DRAFT_1140383 [Armillaria mellea]|nr:hypothetical protein F5146DRAFT_1140383 [Armillaria mellea]
MEAYNVWKTAKLKVEKAMEAAEVVKKKANDRAKKLALLKADKERKAMEATKAKELEEEKERQRVRDLKTQKSKEPEAVGEDDEDEGERNVDPKGYSMEGLSEKAPKIEGQAKGSCGTHGGGSRVPLEYDDEELVAKWAKTDSVPKRGDVEFFGRVLEQTLLSQANLYVFYIHKTLSGKHELPELPMVAVSTIVNLTAPPTTVNKEPTDGQVSGCIVNVDYELSEALETMAYVDMDAILHEFEVSGLVKSWRKEYDLCHNWIYAQILMAISDSAEGLLDGDLLDKAGIQLE